MGSTTSTTVSDPAAEQDRRYRPVRIAAAVAGVVSLVLGFVLLYAAAFMACGLAGCTPEYVNNGAILLPLAMAGAVLTLGPLIMTRGSNPQRWRRIAVAVGVGVPLAGFLFAIIKTGWGPKAPEHLGGCLSG